MREVLPVHEPLLVNTVGHSAGALVYGTFVYLLLKDRAGARLGGSRYTLAAAVLAFLWNITSLLVLADNGTQGAVSAALAAVSASALSLLPAVLLQISLDQRFRWIRFAGFALAGVTVALHCGEILGSSPGIHLAALRITTLGFGALTAVSTLALLLSPATDRKRLTSRLVGTMALFLFSLSLAHWGEAHTHTWPGELVAHHAGIVLALFVLLQDYRFLLLDAFVRFLANVVLAAGFVFAAVNARGSLQWAAGNPFWEGMLPVGACLLLLCYAFLRTRLDQLLNRLVFPRQNLDVLLQEIRSHATAAPDERALIEWAARRVAEFFRAGLIDAAGPTESISLAAPVVDLPPADRERLERAGVEAVLPLRCSAHDVRYVLLGRRAGGRRYLGDDYETLHRLQAEMSDQLERFHEIEMRRLVSQAELKALQSQIHPHFLFNALNTLYGVIPKESTGARRMVLNLADLLRYFLRAERTYIPLGEELQIVQAYLEIESLRLGSKLRTEIDVEPDALQCPIPSLTVEPLVENAVKHGIASRPEGGTVRVEARYADDGLRIRVRDTGNGFGKGKSDGAGVGLDNVTRRLRLCYGPKADLRIESSEEGTNVEFLIPHAVEAAR